MMLTAFSTDHMFMSKNNNDTTAKLPLFSWDDVTVENPFVVTVAGGPGTGKTHLGLTMSSVSPVYFADTETRGSFLLNTVFTGSAYPIKYKLCSCWSDLRNFLVHLWHNEDPGTVLIDSGSDYCNFAERHHLHVNELKKVWPKTLWAEIYDMLEKPLRNLKCKGFNIVITSRLKSEYVADEPTGVEIPRLYHAIPHIADVMLQFDKGTPRLHVTKNAWKRSETWSQEKVTRDMGIPEIINILKRY